MPVMQILSALEEETFESPPHFTSIERKKFFALPSSLREAFDDLRTPTNKVCFLLAFGYFKARRKFFGKQFRPPDIEFVAARLGLEAVSIETSAYDKQTALRHQQLILDFFGFRRFDQAGQEFAASEVEAKVRAHRRPKTIFLELVEAITRHKVALPKYYLLAELIAHEINSHKRALIRLIREHLTTQGREMLGALLEKAVNRKATQQDRECPEVLEGHLVRAQSRVHSQRQRGTGNRRGLSPID